MRPLIFSCGILLVAATSFSFGRLAPDSSINGGKQESGSSATAEAKEAGTPAQEADAEQMPLGNFSVSLVVKDIDTSKAFYEKLDFKEVGGELKQNWLVMQNGSTSIGLFQGMFEKNMMTFNPGWDKDKNQLEEFVDVRSIQKTLLDRGLEFTLKADEASTGPASFLLMDPDGNPILVDQHVDKPK